MHYGCCKQQVPREARIRTDIDKRGDAVARIAPGDTEGAAKRYRTGRALSIPQSLRIVKWALCRQLDRDPRATRFTLLNANFSPMRLDYALAEIQSEAVAVAVPA